MNGRRLSQAPLRRAGDNCLVDLKHAVFVDAEATAPVRHAEVTAAKTMIDRTAEQLEVKPARLVADAGSAEMLGWLVEERRIERAGAILTTSADPLQAPRSRQPLVCSRSKTLVAFLPTDITTRLRPAQPRVRSVRDLLIPIGRAAPNQTAPFPTRGFLLTRLSETLDLSI